MDLKSSGTIERESHEIDVNDILIEVNEKVEEIESKEKTRESVVKGNIPFDEKNLAGVLSDVKKGKFQSGSQALKNFLPASDPRSKVAQDVIGDLEGKIKKEAKSKAPPMSARQAIEEKKALQKLQNKNNVKKSYKCVRVTMSRQMKSFDTNMINTDKMKLTDCSLYNKKMDGVFVWEQCFGQENFIASRIIGYQVKGDCIFIRKNQNLSVDELKKFDNKNRPIVRPDGLSEQDKNILIDSEFSNEPSGYEFSVEEVPEQAPVEINDLRASVEIRSPDASN